MSSQDETPVSTWQARNVDVTVAHPARRYDYWLGGKDNFAADRESGDAVAQAFPSIRTAAIENRRFLGRAVRYLARDLGIRQFLDIGTGIPTANNTHEVAQAIAPQARVVYVDNDPIVLAHARALLTGTGEPGRTAYIDADLREPGAILNNPILARTLDLSQPVALMLVAVLHFVSDAEDPYGLVAQLVKGLPAGSYLVMSHATNDYIPKEIKADLDEASARTNSSFRFRNRDEVARFFEGHDLIPPGVVSAVEWHAEDTGEPRPSVEDVATWTAVARIHSS